MASEVETAEEAQASAHIKVNSVAVSKPMVIAGLFLATALSALDSTVVTTALPNIVAVLGGLQLYSLVIAAYLLTGTTTVPLFGKLSDMFGRKPVFMVGAALFIGGSALCGLAWDMPSLIAFRALQGLGAGAVLPISLTIIGDVFSIEERARIQGLFGSVWGISSVVGPVIGGAIVQFFDWRWVFFINVPIGIVSPILLYIYLKEPPIHTRQKLDVAGAVTLTVGAGAALIGLQELGRSGGLPWPVTAGVWAGAVLLLGSFVFFEERAPAPILSLALLGRPVILIACLAGLLAGGVLIGYGAYIPVYAQGVWGATPIEAGLVGAPLSIGWPIASAMSGRLLKSHSYRRLIMTGMCLVAAGTLVLLLVHLTDPGSAALQASLVALSSLVVGAGMGLSTTPTLIAVQVSVHWGERGIATAAYQFFRNMGNAVAAAVLGAILTAALVSALAAAGVQSLLREMPAAALQSSSDPSLGPVSVLFNLRLRDTLNPGLRGALADALASGLWWVFIAIFAMGAVGAIIAARFPGHVREA